ncbi:MAG: acyl carrier protein [Alphaproteobacteria bacterium]|nr:acyl carrier protein [Alphaproteobacteria bacterium]
MKTLDHVAAVLARITPEVDLADVDPDEDLREELDIDSMDFLALIQGLAERTGVEIPEKDYPEVRTLNDLVAYLER